VIASRRPGDLEDHPVESIDVCYMFDDRVLPLHEHTATTAARRARRRVAAAA
jgi:hypothetical protein